MINTNNHAITPRSPVLGVSGGLKSQVVNPDLLFMIIEERGEKGYDMAEMIEYYKNEEQIKELLKIGELFENPSGILRRLN